MPLMHLAVLAAVQGITEFLPISSSAHLILVPAFTGWPDQGLTIDVAVHVGTLGAVVLYLGRDVLDMLKGIVLLAIGRVTRGARLFGLLVLATIPVVIAGFLLERYNGGTFRDTEVIGWAMLGFGVVLYYVDQAYLTVCRMEHMSIAQAAVIGLSQVLALIPGTSRSGITMTAARMFGYERPDAARFSMLLSIPTILGAGVLKGWELYKSGNVRLEHDAVISAGLAFAFALVSIALMMSWLKRASFTPFVVYRVALGGLLLLWIYGAFGRFSFVPPPPPF